MKIFGSTGTITVNGSSYSGSNVSIIDGVVTVDGVIQKQKIGHLVNVTIAGDVERVENTAGDVFIRGNVTGSVECVDIGNDVQTISGNVIASGSINGNVKTISGDITSKNPKPTKDERFPAPDTTL
jgi:hypothetical protein